MILDMQNPAGQGGASRDLLVGWSQNSPNPFTDHRKACLAVLNGGTKLSRKAGQFLGGESCSNNPLSDRQRKWLGELLISAGLPPLASGEAQ